MASDIAGNPPPIDEESAESSGAKASSLEYVVDDLAARQECADWLFQEMTAGRLAEDLTAELVGNGWPEDDAVDLVELIRRQTRGERGVVTRDEIVGVIDRRYRRSMGLGWYLGVPVMAAIRLAYSLLNFMVLGRMRQRHRLKDE